MINNAEFIVFLYFLALILFHFVCLNAFKILITNQEADIPDINMFDSIKLL